MRMDRETRRQRNQTCRIYQVLKLSFSTSLTLHSGRLSFLDVQEVCDYLVAEISMHQDCREPNKNFDLINWMSE